MNLLIVGVATLIAIVLIIASMTTQLRSRKTKKETDPETPAPAPKPAPPAPACPPPTKGGSGAGKFFLSGLLFIAILAGLGWLWWQDAQLHADKLVKQRPAAVAPGRPAPAVPRWVEAAIWHYPPIANGKNQWRPGEGHLWQKLGTLEPGQYRFSVTGSIRHRFQEGWHEIGPEGFPPTGRVPYQDILPLPQADQGAFLAKAEGRGIVLSGQAGTLQLERPAAILGGVNFPEHWHLGPDENQGGFCVRIERLIP